MKALCLNALKTPLSLEDREAPPLAEGEVRITLQAAALNRRDYWITQGMYPGIKLPVILGSDGAGVVTETSSGVATELVGRGVIINPGMSWGTQQSAQSGDFQILGMPRDGTFAEQICVPAEYVYPRPDHLDPYQAAALPLAGLTAYRALFTQGQLAPGESVLITGIGGGVATFCLQFAHAAGAIVHVTSSSDEKLERARQLGAASGYNYRQDDWAKRLVKAVGPADLVIDSAGGAGYAALLDAAAPAGRVVSYGATTGPAKLDLFKLFWKQLRLIGSTMGSLRDFAQMLQFVNDHNLVPAVDQVIPLAAGNTALEKMTTSRQFGKIVLSISPD